MDFRDTTVGSVAPLPHGRDHVEAQCVRGKGEAPCECRAVGVTKGGTTPRETAAHLQGESEDRLQSGDRAIVMIGGPHDLATGGARALERLQGLGCRGNGSGGETCHNRYLHESFYSWYRYPTRSLAQFATLVF